MEYGEYDSSVGNGVAGVGVSPLGSTVTSCAHNLLRQPGSVTKTLQLRVVHGRSRPVLARVWFVRDGFTILIRSAHHNSRIIDAAIFYSSARVILGPRGLSSTLYPLSFMVSRRVSASSQLRAIRAASRRSMSS